MLGWVGLMGDPDELIARKGLARSAVDRRFGYREFRKIFSGRKSEIKPALMNQGLIAGIGNIYSDEILFQARIHPRRKTNDLTEKELKSVFDNIKEVLRTAIDRNADYGDFPREYLLRNRRKGAGCPVCGSRLETAKVGGRTAYFCPNCQREQ
jgi:formamidopyrimidine-DNA glycosylase